MEVENQEEMVVETVANDSISAEQTLPVPSIPTAQEAQLELQQRKEIQSYWEFAASCQFIQLFMSAFNVDYVTSFVL
jgi:hypothetical protein